MSSLLPPDTLALLQVLHRELRPAWPVAPEYTALVQPYRAASVPENLRGRRAELIVEASDVAALRAALASDADAVVIDFDDTFSPTRDNVWAAYHALPGLHTDKPLLVRPRALYAVEPHLDFGGPGIAALCDLGVALAAWRDNPPHIYIPKLETVSEAHFWGEALTLAERHLGLSENSVRVCLQIETFAGLMNADALLHRLHGRAYGLNAGRWDYVFSLIKHLGERRTQPLPPRRDLTMDVDAMCAYAEELVRVCRERGAEAIGGTASLAPDPANPGPALQAVTLDKRREAAQGFTAAWAGLPELLDAVREGFEDQSSVNVPAKVPAKQSDLYARLTQLPAPPFIPVQDVREALSIALEVFAAWFGGRGVVTRKGRIEDTATAELARAQLWQWVRVGAALDDGSTLSRERYLSERRELLADSEQASQLLDHLVLSASCAAYFPREAQRLSGGLR